MVEIPEKFLEAPDLIHQGKHLINIAHFSNTDGHSSRQALKLLPIYITEVRKGHFTTRLDVFVRLSATMVSF